MFPGSNSRSMHIWFSHLTSIGITALRISFSLKENIWFLSERKPTSAPSQVSVLITMKTDSLYLLLQEAAAAHSIYLQAPVNPCQYITYPENTSREMPNYDTQIKSEEINWLAITVLLEKCLRSQAELLVLLMTLKRTHNLNLPLEHFVLPWSCNPHWEEYKPPQNARFKVIA